MNVDQLSLIVPSSLPPEQLVPLARAAERSGVRRLWLAEDCFFSGGVASSAAALAATDQLQVGCGIFGAATRHPAILAMEIATLARLHPGRFVPGIGLGAAVWLEQMGVLPAKPLTAVREATTAIRRLLAGEVVSTKGAVFSFDNVQLAAPPSPAPPLYVGVLNAKALEAAGELADGVLLSVLASEEYIHRAAACVAAGAARAGRAAPPLTAYAISSIAHDGAAARAAVRDITAFYLMAGAGSLLTTSLDIDDMVTTTLARGGVDGLAGALDDELIDRLTISGSPTHCAARVHALLEAGADEVALYLYPSDHAIDQIDSMLGEVLDHQLTTP
jgi:5,10-methylenetetrahydromethanopterin reductase